MNPATFFTDDLILENDFVRVSPLKSGDFGQLESIVYHPEIWKMSLYNIAGPTQLQTYMDAALKEKEMQVSYPFLIYDKIQNRLAGSTRYLDISFTHKKLEIGSTWLHPDFHGTGLNKACKFLLLQFAFETLQFNRVELKTDVLNQQSRKAIVKIGAKEEGIFRKHLITSAGRIRDSIFFQYHN